MSTAIQSTRLTIPVYAIELSGTEAQTQRRKAFAENEIKELADSIQQHGLVNPILVRPRVGFARAVGTQPRYELVAGERRYLAAKIAGIEEIDATVRELTDEQVLEVQLIENLQRTDLHPLHEAEGYEQLMKVHGHTADELADKVGKSRRYVYGRIQLLRLCKDAREAFYAGTINATTALLLARIPVEKLQKEALSEITRDRFNGTIMSSRAAEKFVQENYMLRLAGAPFDTGVDNYIPGAKRCGLCPKNTNAQPELFADVKVTSAGACTDPTCFKAKTQRAIEIRIEDAKKQGLKVIEGTAAKKLVSWESDVAGNVSLHSNAYVRLDDKCYDDPKFRTYRKLLGKDVQPILLKTPKGRLVELVERKDVQPLLKKRGVSRSSSSNPDRAREKKAKLERAFRAELYKAIRPRLPEQLGRAELELIASSFFDRLDHEMQKNVCKSWGWEERSGQKHIPKLNDAQLAAFLLDCCYMTELRVFTWSDEPPTKLLAAAKRFKINANTIRKELTDEAKAKKASKKKAARKPK